MLEKDPEKRPTVADLMVKLSDYLFINKLEKFFHFFFKVHPWVTESGESPLENFYEGEFKISEDEINQAFSKLKLRSTVFLQVKMKKSLRDTRMRMLKKSAMASSVKN